MKDFLEKTKDILYNLSDYIIMFSIILGIGLIIGWRLDILFPQTTAMVEQNKLTVSQNTGSKLVEKDIIESKDENDAKKDITKKDEPTIVKVSIPNGTPSSNIGNILVDTGLISSTKEFEDKVQELDLEKSLRFGEFDIADDSSLESIVKIIANQK